MMDYLKGKVTAIIPVFNEERFLAQTLSSVVGCVDSVVIIDNASTDGTVEICNDYKSRYPNIKFIENDYNMGSRNSFTKVLEFVDTEYVVHVGGHDLLTEECISNLKSALVHTDNVIGSYSDVKLIDYNNTVIETRDYSSFSEAFMNNIPLLRLGSLVDGFFCAYIFFGLFKTSEFKACCNEAQSIFGYDSEILTRILLKGRLVYKSGGYNKIRLRPVDLENAYMVRLTGKEDGLKEYQEKIRFGKNIINLLSKAEHKGISFSKRLFILLRSEEIICAMYSIENSLTRIGGLYRFSKSYLKLIIKFVIIVLPFIGGFYYMKKWKNVKKKLEQQ